jgi:hypothetical protein
MNGCRAPGVGEKLVWSGLDYENFTEPRPEQPGRALRNFRPRPGWYCPAGGASGCTQPSRGDQPSLDTFEKVADVGG